MNTLGYACPGERRCGVQRPAAYGQFSLQPRVRTKHLHAALQHGCPSSPRFSQQGAWNEAWRVMQHAACSLPTRNYASSRLLDWLSQCLMCNTTLGASEVASEVVVSCRWRACTLAAINCPRSARTRTPLLLLGGVELAAAPAFRPLILHGHSGLCDAPIGGWR